MCRNIVTLPEIQIIPSTINSDHEFPQFNIYIENSIEPLLIKTKSYRNFFKANYKGATVFLSTVNWCFE